MKRCLLLTLACALAAASPVSAGWRIDRAKAIAEIVWHNPCGGQVQIAWAPLSDGRMETVGHADRCRVWFTTQFDWDWPLFCTYMLHGYGHAAPFFDPFNVGPGWHDYEHSHNPYSVMSSIPMVDPRCAHRGRSYLELHGVLKPR